MSTIDALLKDFCAKFPQAKAFIAKELGYDSGLLVSGEGSDVNDIPAFDYYAYELDPEERLYTFGVHNKLRDWASSHGCYWECQDPGTWILYKN